MPAAQPFGRRVALSFLYSGAGSVTSRVVNAVALLVVFKLISPEDFGVASIVLALFAVLQGVTELGLGAALVQAQRLGRRELDTLFWAAALMALAVYALLFAAAPLVAWFYDEPVLADLLRVQGLGVVLFAGYFVSRSWLVKHLRFGRIAVADNVSLVLSALGMVGLAALGLGPWAIIGGELGNRLGQLVFCQAFRPYRPRFRPAFGRVRPLIRFGLYATGSRLLYNLYVNADYLLVGKLFGAEAVGLYTLAYRIISDPVKALMSVVGDVAFPSFSALQAEVGRLRRYFFTIARVTLSVVGTVAAVLAVFLDWLLLLGGYEPWLEAVPIARVLAGLAVWLCVSPLVPQLLNAVGRSELNFTYSLAAALFMPAAFFAGAQLGLMGVAWAWVVAYPLVVVVLFRFGAGALGMGLGAFLGRIAGGLVVLLPAAALALGLRVGLAGVWAAAPLPVTALGVLAPLGLALGLAVWRERDVIALLRGEPEAVA